MAFNWSNRVVGSVILLADIKTIKDNCELVANDLGCNSYYADRSSHNSGQRSDNSFY